MESVVYAPQKCRLLIFMILHVCRIPDITRRARWVVAGSYMASLQRVGYFIHTHICVFNCLRTTVTVVTKYTLDAFNSVSRYTT